MRIWQTALPSVRNSAIAVTVKKPHSFHLEGINHDKDLASPFSSVLIYRIVFSQPILLNTREDCMKNHQAESPELHFWCNRKPKDTLLHWEKYFHVYKDICHQLASELYLWLRAKLKPVEERILTDYTIFKEYVKTQLLRKIHVIKLMCRFIAHISMQHSPNFIYHKRKFQLTTFWSKLFM